MIGKIIPCPVAVSETGHIRIVGDATKAPSLQPAYKWDYKAVPYDPIKQMRCGQEFNVTKEEVSKWIVKQS